MTEEEVLELLRQKVSESGSQLAFSRAHGVDRSQLCCMLGGAKRIVHPTPQLLRALGLRKVISYEKE